MPELNVFKTETETLDTTVKTVYTAPPNYTGIIISSQITNASDSDTSVTFTYHDSAGDSAGIELLSQFDIPARDTAAGQSGGKLIVAANGQLKMTADKDNNLKLVMGILESLNG